MSQRERARSAWTRVRDGLSLTHLVLAVGAVLVSLVFSGAQRAQAVAASPERLTRVEGQVRRNSARLDTVRSDVNTQGRKLDYLVCTRIRPGDEPECRGKYLFGIEP